MLSYRDRSRVAAMRETQRVALGLFQERGFGSVTVEDVAAAVGMAASTIYRHFGSKEGIVLWHGYDSDVDRALTERLGTAPPLHAIRDALIEALARPWDDDGFQLERIRYIYRTEDLHAAAVEADFRDRQELTNGLHLVLSERNRDAAPILAGAALLALDVAVDRWQSSEGTRRLSQHITEAFETLSHLSELR